MIIIEEILDTAFSQLPEIDGFKPIFDWGDGYELLAIMKRYAMENKSIYPLIYKTSVGSEQANGEASFDLTMVLATLNTEVSLSNRERWAMSYKNVLYPLVNNIEAAIKQSGFFTWNGEFTIKEVPNYGENKENISTDIWDALEFSISSSSIKITNSNTDCINNIIFN